MVVTWMTSHYKLVSATGLVWFGYIHGPTASGPTNLPLG